MLRFLEQEIKMNLASHLFDSIFGQLLLVRNGKGGKIY